MKLNWNGNQVFSVGLAAAFAIGLTACPQVEVNKKKIEEAFTNEKVAFERLDSELRTRTTQYSEGVVDSFVKWVNAVVALEKVIQEKSYSSVKKMDPEDRLDEEGILAPLRSVAEKMKDFFQREVDLAMVAPPWRLGKTANYNLWVDYFNKDYTGTYAKMRGETTDVRLAKDRVEKTYAKIRGIFEAFSKLKNVESIFLGLMTDGQVPGNNELAIQIDENTALEDTFQACFDMVMKETGRAVWEFPDGGTSYDQNCVYAALKHCGHQSDLTCVDEVLREDLYNQKRTMEMAAYREYQATGIGKFTWACTTFVAERDPSEMPIPPLPDFAEEQHPARWTKHISYCESEEPIYKN